MLGRLQRAGAGPAGGRGVLAAGVVLALAGGLTGCGGGPGDEPADAQAIRAAYDTTIGAESAKVSVRGETKTGGKGPAGSIKGHGVIDFANEATAVTMQLPQGDVETRTIGQVLYEKVAEQQRAQVPGNKPWVKIDLGAVAEKQFGADAANKQSGPTDPAQLLGYLRGVSGKVRDLGTAKVGGDETTHYKTKVDLRTAAKHLGPQEAQSTEQLQQRLGTRHLPMEVWLDDEQRVRRLSATMPLAAAPTGGQPGAEVTVTEDLFDFGAELDVGPPPKGDTADVTDTILQRTPAGG
ncbi:MAG: hypothetical protein ACRDPK_17495 [Carbonactinosporaceae bacterium]